MPFIDHRPAEAADPFLADCRRLLAADLRKSLPTKGAYQDALRQAVARLEAVATLADDWHCDDPGCDREGGDFIRESLRRP